jgi:hypothetical protein
MLWDVLSIKQRDRPIHGGMLHLVTHIGEITEVIRRDALRRDIPVKIS